MYRSGSKGQGHRVMKCAAGVGMHVYTTAWVSSYTVVGCLLHRLRYSVDLGTDSPRIKGGEAATLKSSAARSRVRRLWRTVAVHLRRVTDLYPPLSLPVCPSATGTDDFRLSQVGRTTRSESPHAAPEKQIETETLFDVCFFRVGYYFRLLITSGRRRQVADSTSCDGRVSLVLGDTDRQFPGLIDFACLGLSSNFPSDTKQAVLEAPVAGRSVDEYGESQFLGGSGMITPVGRTPAELISATRRREHEHENVVHVLRPRTDLMAVVAEPLGAPSVSIDLPLIRRRNFASTSSVTVGRV